MKRTDEQIQEQIDGLRAILAKPTFRKVTAFGESNTEAIEAQIKTLEERLTEDDVDEREAMGDFDPRQGDVSRDAAAWLAGEFEEMPADGWKGVH